MITLNELIEILEYSEGNKSKMLEYNNEIMEYMTEIDSAGLRVFAKQSDKYVMGFLAAAESCASTSMIYQGLATHEEMTDIINDDLIMGFVSLCIKMTVGIMIHEELH